MPKQLSYTLFSICAYLQLRHGGLSKYPNTPPHTYFDFFFPNSKYHCPHSPRGYCCDVPGSSPSRSFYLVNVHMRKCAYTNSQTNNSWKSGKNYKHNMLHYTSQFIHKLLLYIRLHQKASVSLAPLWAILTKNGIPFVTR